MCDIKMKFFYIQQQNKINISLHKLLIRMCNIHQHYSPINNLNYQGVKMLTFLTIAIAIGTAIKDNIDK